jgi:hypothetical protein
MSQLVKMKRQANFKDFKRFGAFKGLVEEKTFYLTRSCLNWAFFGTRGPLKGSFHSRFKLAHSWQKKPNLHTNSLRMNWSNNLSKKLRNSYNAMKRLLREINI